MQAGSEEFGRAAGRGDFIACPEHSEAPLTFPARGRMAPTLLKEGSVPLALSWGHWELGLGHRHC